jgi:hypothetical protein
MELLGNKKATVPEDEVYDLMAASTVVLQKANVKLLAPATFAGHYSLLPYLKLRILPLYNEIA